ncbi:MAG TPA: T9SS type A sorting domain-containing protein, partial [Chitinophagales bacterium]|nr:T9SS type A sorting domain-containing protein [Chitinophagales bacterium]
TLTKNESLTIALYDVNGKLVRNFISNEQRTAGAHKETLSIVELTSGNYFLTLSNGEQKMSVKMVKQ